MSASSTSATSAPCRPSLLHKCRRASRGRTSTRRTSSAGRRISPQAFSHSAVTCLDAGLPRRLPYRGPAAACSEWDPWRHRVARGSGGGPASWRASVPAGRQQRPTDAGHRIEYADGRLGYVEVVADIEPAYAGTWEHVARRGHVLPAPGLARTWYVTLKAGAKCQGCRAAASRRAASLRGLGPLCLCPRYSPARNASPGRRGVAMG